MCLRCASRMGAEYSSMSMECFVACLSALRFNSWQPLICHYNFGKVYSPRKDRKEKKYAKVAKPLRPLRGYNFALFAWNYIIVILVHNNSVQKNLNWKSI